MPMKWQPQKPNTKPISFCRKIPICNQILTRTFSKCRYNTKKIPRNLGQKYQIPIWFWYFLGIPNFWLPIDITNLYPVCMFPGGHVAVLQHRHCIRRQTEDRHTLLLAARQRPLLPQRGMRQPVSAVHTLFCEVFDRFTFDLL